MHLLSQRPGGMLPLSLTGEKKVKAVIPPTALREPPDRQTGGTGIGDG